MHDPETALNELIFMLFERQHELRLRIHHDRPDAEADWERLHEQLDLLNDRRIELAWQPEVAIEEWTNQMRLANAISKGCDQLEAALSSTKPANYFVPSAFATTSVAGISKSSTSR